MASSNSLRTFALVASPIITAAWYLFLCRRWGPVGKHVEKRETLRPYKTSGCQGNQPFLNGILGVPILKDVSNINHWILVSVISCHPVEKNMSQNQNEDLPEKLGVKIPHHLFFNPDIKSFCWAQLWTRSKLEDITSPLSFDTKKNSTCVINYLYMMVSIPTTTSWFFSLLWLSFFSKGSLWAKHRKKVIARGNSINLDQCINQKDRFLVHFLWRPLALGSHVC